MKTYRYLRGDRTVEAYYDPHLRLWCAYCLDVDGYQVTDAVYGMTRDEVVHLATLSDLNW